jgi:hypothetical protein
VKKATTNLAADDGAASDKIAKLLNLDQSAAWRRLSKAILKGFVVNLETRHRQPRRYRLTNQEVEAELLLPAPEAIAAARQARLPSLRRHGLPHLPTPALRNRRNLTMSTTAKQATDNRWEDAKRFFCL